MVSIGIDEPSHIQRHMLTREPEGTNQVEILATNIRD